MKAAHSLPFLFALISGCDSSAHTARDEVLHVTRGTIAKTATAVGSIEPAREAAIKSRNGGVLTKLFVSLGQRVKQGDPLAEVRPVITDRDLLAAEQSIASAGEGLLDVEEMQGGENLAGRLLQFVQGQKRLDRMKSAAERSQTAARRSLELLREGKVQIGDKTLDYIVRAPIDGDVIALSAREGAPIVGSSTFGSGTVLMIVADMAHPEFRGTVAEIDVGRLQDGMGANIKIGAVPDRPLRATVREVGLRARRANNAVTFPVILDVEPPDGLTIRAGYSAVAEIEVERRADVPVLPERVVRFRRGRAFVRVPGPGGEPEEREIEVGLADGLMVEVLGPLGEGDAVLERVFDSNR